jgi:hypothetical protein
MDLTGFHEPRSHGDWRIEVREIAERGLLALDSRAVTPGTYTELVHRGRIWMSDTPAERRDHMEAYWQAQRRGGRILVHGLGLGMIVKALLDLPNVDHVDVVELDADVIALCGPAFDRYGARVTIHHGNCFDHRWKPGTRWTVVWHDIWPDICTDNLAEMGTLHRKFGRRCDWQGSWCKELLLYHRRRNALSPW